MLEQIAPDQTSSLSPPANLQKNIKAYYSNEMNMKRSFISSYIFISIGTRNNQLQFWLNFTILDTRKLPKTISDVQSYGIEEINKLVNFYGADRKDTCKKECVFQKAYLDKIATVGEFEQTMLEKCKSYREMIDIKNNQINRSRRN